MSEVDDQVSFCENAIERTMLDALDLLNTQAEADFVPERIPFSLCQDINNKVSEKGTKKEK